MQLYNFFPNADLCVTHTIQHRPKKELKEIFNRYSNPEMINNNKTTSPSHRLESIIKGYNKVVYGNIIAEAIGLECIRTKAPRFDAWLNRMEDS